jgi:hypothetical protein
MQLKNQGSHAFDDAARNIHQALVTGGANPSDCAVFSVPDLRPSAVLVGHADWVFGLDWITDNIVVRPGSYYSLRHRHVL